jgi:phage terminase Nu1 subunit (DNA packaging protein)
MAAETEKVDDISRITVSAGVLGKIIGVSDRRIRQLADEGILTKVSSGRYSLQESLHSYILNLRVANDADRGQKELEDKLDYALEKAMHERVKRHMSELQYALMKGNVHRAEDVEAVMTNMLTNFKTKILNLPSKLTPLLVNRSDKKYILELLTDEFGEALEELSIYNASDFYSDEYIDIEEDEGNEDDAFDTFEDDEEDE